MKYARVNVNAADPNSQTSDHRVDLAGTPVDSDTLGGRGLVAELEEPVGGRARKWPAI